MPLFLQALVENLTLTMDEEEHYAYAVATCGVSYGNFGSEAVRAAEKAGIHLAASYEDVRGNVRWEPLRCRRKSQYGSKRNVCYALAVSINAR